MQDGASYLGSVAAHKRSRSVLSPYAPKIEIAAGEFIAKTKVQGDL